MFLRWAEIRGGRHAGRTHARGAVHCVAQWEWKGSRFHVMLQMLSARLDLYEQQCTFMNAVSANRKREQSTLSAPVCSHAERAEVRMVSSHGSRGSHRSTEVGRITRI